MFSRFTTRAGGALYVRTKDIRRFHDATGTDGERHCWVDWLEADERFSETVQGTADENMQRLIDEGRRAFEQSERDARRTVQRGRPR